MWMMEGWCAFRSSDDQTTLAHPRPLRNAGASWNVGSSDRVVTTDLLLLCAAATRTRRESTRRMANASNGIVLGLREKRRRNEKNNCMMMARRSDEIAHGVENGRSGLEERD